MSSEETINQFLTNFYLDIPTPERLACYIRDGKLEICLGGPHSIWYDPVLNQIKLKKKYSCLKPIDGKKLDKNIMLNIFKKLSGIITKSNDELLKEKYRIVKRNKVNQKDQKIIAAYEEAMLRANQ